MFMKLYIFTFGIHHELSDRYQGIYATDETAATKLMFKYHGKNWSACYTEDEFQQLQNRGMFRGLKPLKAIRQEEGK